MKRMKKYTWWELDVHRLETYSCIGLVVKIYHMIYNKLMCGEEQ